MRVAGKKHRAKGMAHRVGHRTMEDAGESKGLQAVSCGLRIKSIEQRAWRDDREGKKVRRWEAQKVDWLNPIHYHRLSQPSQLNQPINSINLINQ